MLGLLCAVWLGSAPVERLGFDAAVNRAVAHHPSMRASREDTRRAEAVVEEVRAPSLPSLGVNGTYTLLDGNRRLNGSVILAQHQLGGNVLAAVPLLNSPRWANWYRASGGVRSSQAEEGDVRRQVAVAAARAWLAVLGQHRVVEAEARAKTTAKAHHDFAQERRVGGIGNALDEARAAQELAASTAALETAEGQLERLEEALGVAVGADAPLDVSSEEPTFASPGSLEEMMHGATDDRLDVQAVKVKAEVASDATKVDWLDYLPLLTLTFQPILQDPPTLTQPLTGWQGQAILSLPLYDGGLRYGQSKERRAVSASAALQVEALVRTAKSDVRVAIEQLARADAALAASRDGARAAAVALELSSAAWKAGTITNLEVVDAERQARDAETQMAVAEDAARQARLDLLVAGGRFP